MKPSYKKLLAWSLASVAVSGAILVIFGLVQLREFNNVASATGGLPWQDAGKISYVQMGCTRSCVGKCCCALCDAACDGSTQINFTGQQGTMFMCVPAGFMYKGGGTVPMMGAGIIAGGISNVMPQVIGIPTMAASRAQRLVDSFKHLFNWL
ncbi:hypothetical protein HGA34_01965 [Candidatus Falkowbacteria bacterium]|nr:hypothetical protein [Candidatus Falkowbacteria bacterium]